jgi:hypothetical protein
MSSSVSRNGVIEGGAKMVMTSQTKDLICAMLTIPVAEKILQFSKSDKEVEKEYSRIVQAYFGLRKVFDSTYDRI